MQSQSLIRAVVDTAALRQNLRQARRVAPGSRVMAVIKANAYGHGLVPAAKALVEADGFAVARFGEALALRAAGLTNRILLLEGVFSAEQLAAAAQARFELMVHSFEQLELLDALAGDARVTAWIKVDSGMNRLGFRLDEFGAAYERMRRNVHVRAEPTLVTHLASADDRRNPQTRHQLDAFASATSGLAGARSIANSAGILAWPAARADWVRPGLMLYGVSPFPSGTGAELGLRPAMTLRTEVIAVKAVKAGETVGYGGSWAARRDTRMAVVAAGYGDGYPRGSGPGTPVQINGRRAPLIGRVSMDMITVDVTDLPVVAVGDPVVLWGSQIPVEEVAAHAGAIAWDLLCGVSQRVPLEIG
ncbi:MAG: alanine racemase [Gammaproteobacteria bacterium]|nr:alanine racemase [Gammaproteobacteria bacterium]MDH5273812.1 alanine racemase [Gammaproteobacteria bacterium]